MDTPSDAARNALARKTLPYDAVREAATCSNQARWRPSSTTANGLTSASAHSE
ncbi:hypothetical protein QLX52_28640 [Streptomyces albus]|uniref:hypothetical protein n=1 Tax=Streptomyces albus TaxID=1888 RepID=UPI0024ACC135|nr:hypothetical protein [Streptomyces albus]MDI6412776.1 hypothetical protein [Streptomyces albus]